MSKSLTQLGKQLAAIWGQLGLNQRLSVALGGVVVVGGLVALMFWSSRVNYALLYGKLDDAEAAKVVAALEESNVPHKIGQGGGAIYVPQDKVHTMRMQLAAKGIPRGDGVGFEIFDRPNFGISDFMQRANYIRALQGELGRTVAQLDEVESARVMIVLPENRLLLETQKRPTASVFVKVKGSGSLPSSAVNSIRFLVANAVEGLVPGQVSVVDNRGHVLSEHPENDTAAGLTSTQLTARRNFEQYLSKKAEGMLDAVLGPGQAVVRVSAEINFDTMTRTEEKFDPEGQVVRTSTVDDENTETTNGAGTGGGAPGISGNLGGETNVAAAGQNNNKSKKKTTQNQYEINRTTSNMTQLAGGLKRVTAAVFVAARTEGAGAERKVVARPPEELEKLRRIVQSALGIQSGDTTRKDEITLEEMPFNDTSAEATQALVKDEKRQFWLVQGQKIIYPAIALGVLFFFWRQVNRTPAQGLPTPAAPTGNGHLAAGALAGDWGQPDMPQVASAEAVHRLMRERPDAVSGAIQTWLGKDQSLS